MKKQTGFLVLLLMLLALILAACGTKEDNTTGGQPPDSPEEETPGTTDESSGGIVAGALIPNLEPLDDNTYRYTLTNQTEEIKTFSFTSGQRIDVSLSDESGSQVFLMSSTAMFTQALGEETVKQGEELSYEFDIPELDLAPGTYKVEAWLTPKEGQDFKAESEYTVE
ncbi:BsuPI-related putative proteinase inhibitor [Planococcus sp. YIM B11945]|uniref:BsuPI-related putative proteinase inhibitor n=1 Tax=Planococcus sp. YIM B11945 TaxID=3435410 RepID=UPI003D7E17C2